MYAYTVGGKRILGKSYLFTQLVIGLYIDFKFTSVEQSDNATSSNI